MLEGYPPLSNNVTFEQLVAKKFVVHGDWGCLMNSDRSDHTAVNYFAPWDSNITDLVNNTNVPKGTTFWINELIGVGHVMYDLILLEILKSTKIDRIILQRPLCHISELCDGIGTWASFYRGYYTAAISAFQPGVPIYFRRNAKEKEIRPVYLSSNASSKDGYMYIPHHVAPNYTLYNGNCFERLIRRRPCKAGCAFYPGLSKWSADAFKKSAYSMIRDVNLSASVAREKNEPVKVLLAYRGMKASRRIANIQEFINTLHQNLLAPQFLVQSNCTSSGQLTFEDQVKMVASAHIVISEHGAFESNVMFMRRGSLFLELRGSYQWPEFINFENLARLFGVYHAHIVTRNLDWHWRVPFFNITVEEQLAVADIVKKFAQEHL